MENLSLKTQVAIIGGGPSQETAKKAPIHAAPKTLCSTPQTHSRSGVYSVYQMCIAILRRKNQLSH